MSTAASVDLGHECTVAVKVLQWAIEAAVELAGRGYPVTTTGIVSIVAARHGFDVATIVREHLVVAGVYPPVRKSP